MDGFTKRYSVHRLVYYEVFDSMLDAIAREKQMKGWHRHLKLKTIEAANPEWTDLPESFNALD